MHVISQTNIENTSQQLTYFVKSRNNLSKVGLQRTNDMRHF